MVIALVGLIFILLLVFVLIIRGQSKKYAKKTDSGELAPRPAGWPGLPRVCLPFSKGGRSGWAGVFLSPGNASALIGGDSLGFVYNLHLLFCFQLEEGKWGSPARWRRGGHLIYGDGVSDRMSISPPPPPQGTMPSLVPWATER